MAVSVASISVSHTYALPVEARRCIRSYETVWLSVPYGYWEPNPGLLEEQPVLVSTESSLQPQFNVLVTVCVCMWLVFVFMSMQGYMHMHL